jgi:hypothetical protein
MTPQDPEIKREYGEITGPGKQQKCSDFRKEWAMRSYKQFQDWACDSKCGGAFLQFLTRTGVDTVSDT